MRIWSIGMIVVGIIIWGGNGLVTRGIYYPSLFGIPVAFVGAFALAHTFRLEQTTPSGTEN